MCCRCSLAMLVPLLGTGLVLSWLIVQPGATEEAPPAADLKERVLPLVKHLDDQDAAKRTAAVATLIELGPAVLPLLPERHAKLSETQRKNLAAVRKTLRERMIQHDLAPRTATIDNDRILLSKALAELTKQTGIPVVDRRGDGADPPLRLKLKNVTFWQAVDAIAEGAGARVCVYQRDGQIALVPRGVGYQTLPTSYNGLFRISVQFISAKRNLNSEKSQYRATLEIAWEPRFCPFMLETKPQSIVIRGDNQQELAGHEMGNGRSAIGDKRMAVTIDVPLPSLPRTFQRIHSLKGALTLIGPTHMRHFVFDTLDRLKADVHACQQRQGEVTVKVQKLDAYDESLTVEIALEYPSEGPQFESFESWLDFNEIYLQNIKSKHLFPKSSLHIETSSGTRALIMYHFVDEPSKKLIRGNLADWQLVYKTPGLIAEIPVAFEFKDLPLP